MKNLFLITIVLLSFHKSFSQAKISISDAINIAGRQRMLGQRMAKDKVYLAADVNSTEAKKELEYTISIFQNGLKILKDFAPTDLIKSRVEEEEKTFNVYKTYILDDSKKAMQIVVNTNTIFLKICDNLVIEILEYAKQQPLNNINIPNKNLELKIPEATNIAGELRYLTQRLTLYYAINNYHIKNISPSEIDKIIKTLDKNINYLTALDINTLKIEEEINDIRIDWMKLKKGIYKDEKIDFEAKKINPIKLYKVCNRILYKANVTAKMYTELAKS
ncbi:type IV pili methyl-accepting chemotaxis transducer N-terminal domain-containing protein [Wenyingzhuangia sp. chi5]|uniref:Type IV pili methyl-accepting chemotaxis transducer N-terminal domain-containing protein n=1 Tax=Wenyingzhuangia gilva TaxID=3057677 RepID=A0ABT8VPB2_9FLAO|nr:type IV pili methyl-accepting chemotaxis transducer N-terminal domain-containing protein [Wenyingzhuangia sp. chi5]MDO3693805.1 type IV pili methyl-accepting chemotaxis transducer N-terminal domain-containing protein [Wenyingzhuangia sp. chi5]